MLIFQFTGWVLTAVNGIRDDVLNCLFQGGFVEGGLWIIRGSAKDLFGKGLVFENSVIYRLDMLTLP